MTVAVIVNVIHLIQWACKWILLKQSKLCRKKQVAIIFLFQQRAYHSYQVIKKITKYTPCYAIHRGKYFKLITPFHFV